MRRLVACSGSAPGGAGRAGGRDRAVFASYLRGLRDAGWRGDRGLARLGFAAALALRWFVLHGTLRALVGGPEARRGTTGESVDDALRQLVLFTDYLLDRADEARALAERYGLLL